MPQAIVPLRLLQEKDPCNKGEEKRRLSWKDMGRDGYYVTCSQPLTNTLARTKRVSVQTGCAAGGIISIAVATCWRAISWIRVSGRFNGWAYNMEKKKKPLKTATTLSLHAAPIANSTCKSRSHHLIAKHTPPVTMLPPSLFSSLFSFFLSLSFS